MTRDRDVHPVVRALVAYAIVALGVLCAVQVLVARGVRAGFFPAIMLVVAAGVVAVWVDAHVGDSDARQRQAARRTVRLHRVVTA